MKTYHRQLQELMIDDDWYRWVETQNNKLNVYTNLPSVVGPACIVKAILTV